MSANIALRLRVALLFLILLIFTLPIPANGQKSGCKARNCYNGRIVEIKDSEAKNYALLTKEGTVLRLDPRNNFPIKQLGQLLNAARVQVVGKPITDRFGKSILVDYVLTEDSQITSRFGLIRIKPTKKSYGVYFYRGNKRIVKLKTNDNIHIHALYRLHGREVVLFAETGGSGGHGPFQLLTLRQDGSVKVSKRFGNGLYPEVKVTNSAIVLNFKNRAYSIQGETITYKNDKIRCRFHPYPTKPALTADLLYSISPYFHIVLKPVMPQEHGEALCIVTRPPSSFMLGEKEYRYTRPVLGLKPIEWTFPEDGNGHLGDIGTYRWKCVVGGITVAEGTFTRNALDVSCGDEEVYLMPEKEWTAKGWVQQSSISFEFEIADRADSITGQKAIFSLQGRDASQFKKSITIDKQWTTVAAGYGTEFPLKDNHGYVWSWSIGEDKWLENTIEMKMHKKGSEMSREIRIRGYRKPCEIVCP
jgi:hypothetical protein